MTPSARKVFHILENEGWLKEKATLTIEAVTVIHPDRVNLVKAVQK